MTHTEREIDRLAVDPIYCISISTSTDFSGISMDISISTDAYPAYTGSH